MCSRKGCAGELGAARLSTQAAVFPGFPASGEHPHSHGKPKLVAKKLLFPCADPGPGWSFLASSRGAPNANSATTSSSLKSPAPSGDKSWATQCSVLGKLSLQRDG